MQTACRAAVLVMVGGLVAGCSETGFQDFFGAGKYAPDETQVSTNEPLAVPPDLQLRPPSNEPPPQRVASQDTQLRQQDLVTAPGSDEAPTADEAPREAQPQPYQPPQQQPQQLQQQAAVEDPDDPYARWGVSRHHPDGREKTQLELNAEMREKRLERERQKDPNYGTIWNMGSIWSDG